MPRLIKPEPQFSARHLNLIHCHYCVLRGCWVAGEPCGNFRCFWKCDVLEGVSWFHCSIYLDKNRWRNVWWNHPISVFSDPLFRQLLREFLAAWRAGPCHHLTFNLLSSLQVQEKLSWRGTPLKQQLFVLYCPLFHAHTLTGQKHLTTILKTRTWRSHTQANEDRIPTLMQICNLCLQSTAVWVRVPGALGLADGYGCHGNGQSPVDDVRGTETSALQGKHPPFLDLPRTYQCLFFFCHVFHI